MTIDELIANLEAVRDEDGGHRIVGYAEVRFMVRETGHMTTLKYEQATVLDRLIAEAEAGTASPSVEHIGYGGTQ